MRFHPFFTQLSAFLNYLLASEGVEPSAQRNRLSERPVAGDYKSVLSMKPRLKAMQKRRRIEITAVRRWTSIKSSTADTPVGAQSFPVPVTHVLADLSDLLDEISVRNRKSRPHRWLYCIYQKLRRPR